MSRNRGSAVLLLMGCPSAASLRFRYRIKSAESGEFEVDTHTPAGWIVVFLRRNVARYQTSGNSFSLPAPGAENQTIRGGDSARWPKTTRSVRVRPWPGIAGALFSFGYVWHASCT